MVWNKVLNPLTSQEKKRVRDLANLQYVISRKHISDPIKSSFYFGRSVGMGKIAKSFNPRIRYGSRVRLHGFATKQEAEEWVKPFKLAPDRLVRIWYSDSYQKWMAGVYIKESNPKRRFDPILEDINDEEEEMIGTEINPRISPHWLEHYAKRHGGTYTRRKLPSGLILHRATVPGKFPMVIDNPLPRYSLKEIHKGLWLMLIDKKYTGNIQAYSEKEARRKANQMYRNYQKYVLGKNPILSVIGTAAITGVGLGAGFKAVDAILGKRKRNPHLYQSPSRIVKDKLEWLYHNQPKKYYLYEDAIISAIVARQKSKIPREETLRLLTLPELRSCLRFANKLY